MRQAMARLTRRHEVKIPDVSEFSIERPEILNRFFADRSHPKMVKRTGGGKK
jgi:hypothetical protein